MKNDSNKASTYWDNFHKDIKGYGAFRPDPVLSRYLKLISKGKVLDLGLGEGRNALFFVQNGFEVKGIDISETAIQSCIKRAKEAKLEIDVKLQDIRNIKVPENTYSLIIATMVLQFLNKKERDTIFEKIKKGLIKNGIVFLRVFSLEDPSYKIKLESDKFEMIEPNTFFLKKRNMCIHYFSEKEVKSIFRDFQIINFSEIYSLDLAHGEPHYHGMITYMGKKI
ncbi:MAG: methyltransferase domain-containing protein [Candidatus Cloacimonetes bacterium]|nr:methyltransferase domain-containing protein [Candidatus Cloacimonadota bacterium]